MKAAYRWVITKDRIADPSRPEGTNSNAKGITGPSNLDKDLKDNPAKFSLYDDDGMCYYEGTIYGDYTGFEPMDDFGGWNAGCARVKLNGHWL